MAPGVGELNLIAGLEPALDARLERIVFVGGQISDEGGSGSAAELLHQLLTRVAGSYVSPVGIEERCLAEGTRGNVASGADPTPDLLFDSEIPRLHVSAFEIVVSGDERRRQRQRQAFLLRNDRGCRQ